jgi:hypothetical protein
LETAVDVQEVRKLDAYLKRVFGNPKIRVVPRPKKDDSAEVYIGEEFIGVLFVDDEDDDRSFQFQMAILEEDLADVGCGACRDVVGWAKRSAYQFIFLVLQVSRRNCACQTSS